MAMADEVQPVKRTRTQAEDGEEAAFPSTDNDDRADTVADDIEDGDDDVDDEEDDSDDDSEDDEEDGEDEDEESGADEAAEDDVLADSTLSIEPTDPLQVGVVSSSSTDSQAQADINLVADVKPVPAKRSAKRRRTEAPQTDSTATAGNSAQQSEDAAAAKPKKPRKPRAPRVKSESGEVKEKKPRKKKVAEDGTEGPSEPKKKKKSARLGVNRRKLREIIADTALDQSTIDARRQEAERLSRNARRANEQRHRPSASEESAPVPVTQPAPDGTAPTELLSPEVVITKVETKPAKSAQLNWSSLLSDDDDEYVKDSDEELQEKMGDISQQTYADDHYNVPDEYGRIVVNINGPDSEAPIMLDPDLVKNGKPHQIGGIRFMWANIVDAVDQWSSHPGFGCILAHTMGLGKTFQVLAFLHTMFSHTPIRTAMVIVPKNTIPHWEEEHAKWLSRKNVPIFMLNDTLKTMKSRVGLVKRWHDSRGVLVLGYEMFRLMLDHVISKPKAAKKKKKDDDEEEQQTTALRALLDPGADVVICDEGHRIKNNEADISVLLKMVKTRRRVVITGYPLQNNLKEYWCMVDFVRPAYLGTAREFQNMFERPILNGQCKDSGPADVKLMKYRSHALQQLIQGFVQRRTHESILQHDLPKKYETVIYVKLSPVQEELYKALVSSVSPQTLGLLRFGALCAKICNHPDLLYDQYSKSYSLARERKTIGAKRLSEEREQESRRIRTVFRAHGYECPQLSQDESHLCDRNCETEAARKLGQHTFFPGSQGSSAPRQHPIAVAPNQQHLLQQQQQRSIQRAHQAQQQPYTAKPTRAPELQSLCSIEEFLTPASQEKDVEDHAGLLGLFDSFDTPMGTGTAAPRMDATPPSSNPLQDFLSQPATDDFASASNTSSPLRVIGQDMEPDSDSRPHTGLDDDETEEKDFDDDDDNDIELLDTTPSRPAASYTTSYPSTSRPVGFEGGQSARYSIGSSAIPQSYARPQTYSPRAPYSQSSQLSRPAETESRNRDSIWNYLSDKEGSHFQWAEPIFNTYTPGAAESSYKIVLLLRIIRQCILTGERLLVFSQSKLTLDFIEEILAKQFYPGTNKVWEKDTQYYRLDGDSATSERQTMIRNFNEKDHTARLFLLSTKAGGIGINLVAANRVIIFDSAWNPCHDAQAVCRIYRYGQRRTCHIYRFISDGTLERKIYERQVRKQSLSSRIVDVENPDRPFTDQELAELFDYEPCQIERSDGRFRDPSGGEDAILKAICETMGGCLACDPVEHDGILAADAEDMTTQDKKSAMKEYYQARDRATAPPPPPMPFGTSFGYQQQQQAFPQLATPRPVAPTASYLGQQTYGAIPRSYAPSGISNASSSSPIMLVPSQAHRAPVPLSMKVVTTTNSTPRPMPLPPLPTASQTPRPQYSGAAVASTQAPTNSTFFDL
eukprot:m.779200 g.779200  ORF g.779200 m.779200 type:complete len:1424 (-) comp59130_c0_seq4:96-4367(-)